MLVAVKFLDEDILKDVNAYKTFLKQQKRNIYGREYFYQTDDDIHVNDIVLVPVDYKYQTNVLRAAVVVEVNVSKDLDSLAYDVKWIYSKVEPTKYLNKKIDNMRKADLLVKLNKRERLIAKINDLKHSATDNQELADILAKIDLDDIDIDDLDDLIEALRNADFKF